MHKNKTYCIASIASGFMRLAVLSVIVLCTVLLNCSSNFSSDSDDIVLIEIVSPKNGGSWAVYDTVPIEVRFFRDSMSRANLEFSIDNGQKFDFIRAQRTSAIIEGYSHNYYNWIPADNGISSDVEVVLRASNYENKGQSYTTARPISIYP